ncbi:unnamed protein product [Calypogeia fissa]
MKASKDFQREAENVGVCLNCCSSEGSKRVANSSSSSRIFVEGSRGRQHLRFCTILQESQPVF